MGFARIKHKLAGIERCEHKLAAASTAATPLAGCLHSTVSLSWPAFGGLAAQLKRVRRREKKTIFFVHHATKNNHAPTCHNVTLPTSSCFRFSVMSFGGCQGDSVFSVFGYLFRRLSGSFSVFGFRLSLFVGCQ